MSRRRSKPHKGSTYGRKKKTAVLSPLILNLYDETLPPEVNEESAHHLRSVMVEWTIYIDRLLSRPKHPKLSLLLVYALLRRGVAHLTLEEWQAAIRDLSQVITMQVGEAETNTAYLYRAEANDALEHDDDAIRDWTHVLYAIEHASAQQERPSPILTSHGYACRGRLYARKENYKQTIADCDRALVFDTACAEAYSVRGRAYSLLGQSDRALADGTRAIELQGWPVHYYRRGLTQRAMGNYEQALADVDRAYQSEPENKHFGRERTELIMLQLVCLERERAKEAP